MCGSALRAERSSLASASLANARDAVLLAARMRPRTARVFRIVCRNDQYWYPTNAADVSSSTSPLISTSIAVSFRLMGHSRSDISTLSWGNDFSHTQELGADRQVSRLRRLEVDLEPDAAPVGHEANHAAALGESVGVTHREDRPVLEARQNALRSVPLGPTDEQDVARLDLIHAVVAPDLESPPSQALVTHGLVQNAPERIISKSADHERRVGVGKGPGWPIDELREVEQEHGLHVVFRGPHGLRRQPASGHEQRSEGERPRGSGDDRAQKRPSTNP